jgi:hypothetical protein
MFSALKSLMSGTSPAAAAAARRCSLFWPAATTGFIGMAFDPDHGKNQDGGRASARGDTHGSAQLARSRIRWKFNDGAHVNLSAPLRHNLAGAASLRTGMVNGLLKEAA